MTGTASPVIAAGIHFVDLAIARGDRAPLRFTFRWLDDVRWEGRDYKVGVRER